MSQTYPLWHSIRRSLFDPYAPPAPDANHLQVPHQPPSLRLKGGEAPPQKKKKTVSCAPPYSNSDGGCNGFVTAASCSPTASLTVANRLYRRLPR